MAYALNSTQANRLNRALFLHCCKAIADLLDGWCNDKQMVGESRAIRSFRAGYLIPVSASDWYFLKYRS